MSKNGNGANEGPANQTFLLDVLFSHKMAWVRRLLKDKGLPQSGTADELRSRVAAYLSTRIVETHDLIDLLDEVEGWGDQHIYFYKATDKLLADLLDEQAFRDRLRTHHVARLFNRRLPLILPDTAKLSEIQWSDRRLRLLWVEKREYRDRVENEDREEGDLVFDAYKVMLTRGIVSFNCNLVTGNAELMVQRLPSGNNYPAEKTRFEAMLGRFIDLSQLQPSSISQAIKKIDKVTAVRKRSAEWATMSGDRIKYTSRSRKTDAYADPTIRKSRDELGNLIAGRLGNYYWPIGDRHIHITLYAKDQRVGIFGECTPTEVADVLSAIRSHC